MFQWLVKILTLFCTVLARLGVAGSPLGRSGAVVDASVLFALFILEVS